MDNFYPFSQETLNDIFKASTTHPDRILSRESGGLEFKESFGWGSIAKYLRSSAAFANTKGGHIVFGVKNSPHILKGLSGASLATFEALDPEQMSNHFNEHFAPEIIWDIHQYELHGKIYGLLYIYESKNKPVICCKNAGSELKEGDIYYRYRGRTQCIKYPELKTILDERREQEQQLWLNHLSNISHIGVRDAGIFDIQTGQVTGSSGSFIIDESLLCQLSFIKEGEFSEVRGKPALKLIGKVEPFASATPAPSSKQIVKTKGIRIGDIVLGFLDNKLVSDPSEFIKQICFENTAFLPVYYFMKKARLNANETEAMLDGIVTRSPAKTKLLKRISGTETQHLPLPSVDNVSAKAKRSYAEQLKQKQVKESLSPEEMKICLQAIRGLTQKEILKLSTYLRQLLKTWFNQHYSSVQGSLADNLRRAISWVDEALHKEDAS